MGDPSKIHELSQAFYPATPEGIANELYALKQELWALPGGVMNPKHNELAGRRDHLKSIAGAHEQDRRGREGAYVATMPSGDACAVRPEEAMTTDSTPTTPKTVGPVQTWLRRHQAQFHEDFHAYEGPPETCTEGYCKEINPLVAEDHQLRQDRDDLVEAVIDWHMTHGYKDNRAPRDSFADCTNALCRQHRVLLTRIDATEAVHDEPENRCECQRGYHDGLNQECPQNWGVRDAT